MIQVTTGDITAQLTGRHSFAWSNTSNSWLWSNRTIFVPLIPGQPNTTTGGQIESKHEAVFQTNSGAVDKETITVSGTFEIENQSESHTYSI
jgi:hypothetical protein